MLAYAAGRRTVATTRSSPNALLAIIGVHVALAAIVMSAKMEIQRHVDGPFIVRTIKDRTEDPPPRPVQTKVTQATPHTPIRIDNPPHNIHLGRTTDISTTPPTRFNPGTITGGGAAVTLKLTIDEDGRVVAAEAVGRADPAFLDSARRYVLAHWRFRPASEDG